jgi:CRISPR-associated protein Csx10
MKKLYYTITTLEPLIITQHSDDPNMYETLQYIRGTVMQGVFAQRYLKNKTADVEFTRLIVNGHCTFSNAFPIENGKTFLPAPIALVREKYHSKKAHNLLGRETKEQTKGISSFVSISANVVTPLTIKKEIRLHNEINGKTRTTMESKLFNYQSLPANMVFKGYITIKKDDDENKIKPLIENGDNIRMGRSATSEYGKVRFEWINEAKNNELKTDGKVIMTLLSDAIIFNENGFSSLAVKDISSYLEYSHIEQSISRKARIEGFLNIWKLRKPSENVFAAGSSFLLDKLPANSENLANYGLGERTHEGYGQVSFSMLNPSIEYLEYREWNDPKRPKPLVMPPLTNDILIAIIFKRVKEQAIQKALEDAENTERLLNNHLLGKLSDMSEDVDSFDKNVKLLKDIARKQLEKSHVQNQTLLNHLIERATHLETICPLTKMIDDKIIDLSLFKSELARLYFEQYFNQLRRKNINNEKDGKR